jgi:ribosome biogenesis GTPase / thiamine phosphate phosphatase
MFRLQDLGWDHFFAKQLEQEEKENFTPARVAEESRGMHRLYSARGESWGELSGKLRHAAHKRADLPAVGDWVLAQIRSGENRATIHRVFARRTKFSRKMAGNKTEEQIVAANIDTLLLVSSLNREFNPRRLERYLSLAWESGARPILVLNKADACEDAESFLAGAESAGLGVRILLTSALRGDGIAELQQIVRDSGTAALLGSSGVGKSTLINAILGEDRQFTSAVCADDDRGRHTTTSRQLILVPGGGVLIDTPGMRELQLWESANGIERAFTDVQDLAAQCKFRDCRHQSEPGCAVRAAAEIGHLDAERLSNYHKLEREEQFLASKQDAAIRADRTKAVRRLMKNVNRMYRDRDKP